MSSRDSKAARGRALPFFSNILEVLYDSQEGDRVQDIANIGQEKRVPVPNFPVIHYHQSKYLCHESIRRGGEQSKGIKQVQVERAADVCSYCQRGAEITLCCLEARDRVDEKFVPLRETFFP
jgi:hypothetical protein